MLKSFLQGKPFGHPLHPALVHFPIGLLILSLLLDFGSHLVPGGGGFYRGALYTMAFGVIMGLVAAQAGLTDWLDIRSDHPAKNRATIHMLLNVTALGLFGLNLAFRADQPDLAETPFIYFGMSIFAVLLILISGYLGGTLVYDDGIGAGRHRRETQTPRETIMVSTKDARSGLVQVARADSLAERETLRVDCDGTIMTIARLNDQFYAFQEFCTHRYGPLSEGAFYDHQVECPWHRSCFDVRTGKVTEVPAKVDLKTFPLTVHQGMISLVTKKDGQ